MTEITFLRDFNKINVPKTNQLLIMTIIKKRLACLFTARQINFLILNLDQAAS